MSADDQDTIAHLTEALRREQAHVLRIGRSYLRMADAHRRLKDETIALRRQLVLMRRRKGLRA